MSEILDQFQAGARVEIDSFLADMRERSGEHAETLDDIADQTRAIFEIFVQTQDVERLRRNLGFIRSRVASLNLTAAVDSHNRLVSGLNRLAVVALRAAQAALDTML